MQRIALSQGRFALVDDEDYEWLNQWKWCAARSSKTDHYYAQRSVYQNGKQTLIKMHRFIMNPPANLFIDHIDGDGLNNQRSNLRIVNMRQNMQNQRIKIRQRSSRYVGVYYEKHKKRWRAQIEIDHQNVHLGSYATEEEAYAAYLKKLEELGEPYVDNL